MGDLLDEIRGNKGIKIKILILLFRLSGLSKFGGVFYFFYLFVPLYRFYSEIIIGLDLSYRTSIGFGLKIYHGYGIVVHPDCVIGRNCTIRQGVTLGNKITHCGVASSAPVLGDHVELGANCIVIGPVSIGDNVVIGAGAVVTKSISENTVVVGFGFRELEKAI